MPIGNPWTPEQDALLTELWCSGMPASQIVASFPERTKNAIIGRVHRLRLERKVADTGTGRSRTLVQPKRQHPFKPKAPLVMLEPQPILIPEQPHGGVTIMELREHHCREVIDAHGAPDGLALYCGKQKVYRSFCEQHAAINYVPYSARRRV